MNFSSLTNLVESVVFGNGWWFHPTHGYIDVGPDGDHHWSLSDPKNDKYFAKVKKSTTEGFWVTAALKFGWVQVRYYPGMIVLNLNKLDNKTKDNVWEICKKTGASGSTPVKIFELHSGKISDTNVGNIIDGFDFGDDLNEAKATWGNAYWYNPRNNALIDVVRTHADTILDNEEIFGYSAEEIFGFEQKLRNIVEIAINDGWWRVTQQGSTKIVYVDTRDTNNLQRNLKKLLDAMGVYYDTKILVASYNGKDKVYDFYFSDGEIRRDTSLRNEARIGEFDEREFESLVDGFSDEIRDRYSLQRFELFLDTRYKNTLCLDKIQVSADDRRGGIGSAAMKDVCDFADDYRLNIWLTLASPDNKEFGTESVEKLQKFYSRFGFVVNTGAKGRGMKVPYVCDMYRKPK